MRGSFRLFPYQFNAKVLREKRDRRLPGVARGAQPVVPPMDKETGFFLARISPTAKRSNSAAQGQRSGAAAERHWVEVDTAAIAAPGRVREPQWLGLKDSLFEK